MKEVLRRVLTEHWLTAIVCDHKAKTDRAACYCTTWRGDEMPNVGAAVQNWIDHVLDHLGPSPAQGENGPCKYCLAGNPVNKDGWHVTEYQGGYPYSSIYCIDKLRAAAALSRQSPTRMDDGELREIYRQTKSDMDGASVALGGDLACTEEIALSFGRAIQERMGK